MPATKQLAIVINSRDDADRALQRMGELQGFIKGEEKDARQDSNRFQHQKSGALKPSQAQERRN